MNQKILFNETMKILEKQEKEILAFCNTKYPNVDKDITVEIRSLENQNGRPFDFGSGSQ